MAYSVANERTRWDIGTGRATGGVIGIFAALGLGLALLAFVSAYALPQETDANDAASAAGAIGSVLTGVLPFVAVPLVALLAGVWAGQATRSGGQGALAGALGTLIGTVLLFVLVGIGFALGAAAAGIDMADLNAAGDNVNVGVPAGLTNTLQYLATVAGLTYLIANILTSALAAAIIGALLPQARGHVADDRDVARGPARI